MTLAQLDLKPLPPPRLSGQGALEFSWALPSEVAREIDGLARRFATELGRPRYEPDWSRIFELERTGHARIWGARTLNGMLVGYLGVTLNSGLFTQRSYARIEAGYLSPEWRNGPLGIQFIKSGIAAIKALNSQSIEWETNDDFEPDANGRSRLALLLERLGFEQVGTCMRLK